MLLVNIDYIPGRELEPLGLVKGSTIQSKNIGRDITQSFKTLVGGEQKSYTDMMDQARALATQRMEQEAEALGADAIELSGYNWLGLGKKKVPTFYLDRAKAIRQAVKIPLILVGGVPGPESAQASGGAR